MPADGALAPAPPPTPAVGSLVLLQSPPSAFPLGSNDDQLERARARAAARAASVRRRSLASSIAPRTSLPNLLNRGQVMDLFHNCIKLASENKINKKNTWELGLIDHLSEIIQVGDDDDDDETNFQKASCTLEAGVKIYSLRVDSVHSEAYKVLGGINRAGSGEEADLEEGGNAEPAQDEGVSKKYADRRISPASTLESSFEALNVKKFDDPLYHQTTAQFDEGGAKGLLLYNLGVYGSCRVLFDSFEAPDKCILSDMRTEKAEVIDLSLAKEQIEEMVAQMPLCSDISPTQATCSNKLPEDCHYQPESLVKLFFLPDVLCLARRRRKPLDDTMENNDDFIPSGPWDDDSFGTDHVDEGHACSDVEEPVYLINKPRQVNKIDIQYNKVSKQLDVHALKEVLWNHIHTSAETDDKEREEPESLLLRLSLVLHDLPSSNPDAAVMEILPHLYFICLLHLANEHGLTLRGHPTLDEIDIYVLTSPLVK